MSGFSNERSRLGGRILAAHTLLVAIFLYAPIAVLVLFSFNAGRQTALWEGFTLEWYGRLFRDGLVLGAVGNSLIVAAVTTAVASIALSVVVEYSAAGASGRGSAKSDAASASISPWRLSLCDDAANCPTGG